MTEAVRREKERKSTATHIHNVVEPIKLRILLALQILFDARYGVEKWPRDRRQRSIAHFVSVKIGRKPHLVGVAVAF